MKGEGGASRPRPFDEGKGEGEEEGGWRRYYLRESERDQYGRSPLGDKLREIRDRRRERGKEEGETTNGCRYYYNLNL